MGKWLSKMERKYGKYAIRNLTLYLVVGYVIGFAVDLIAPEWMDYLMLDPYQILHGQVWRLFTWVLNPSYSNILFFIIMLFFYYSIGTTLENTWGAFRYNVFMFGGFFFTVIGAFVLYAIMAIFDVSLIDGMETLTASAANYIRGYYISQYFSAYYINLSIFLAFAITYPDMRVMLYFVIPIKVKWMAWVDIALLAIDFLFGNWVYRVVILVSLLNVLIFYLSTRGMFNSSPGNWKARRNFNKQVHQGQQRSNTSNPGMRPTRHKCAICGRTEADNPNLTFHYCSKCVGNYEYCQDHLFTHEHKV
ncbi:MAG: derlin [Lachnospiraceae bacterium]|nr:derlin [Lachnospiraceae bacterium]